MRIYCRECGCKAAISKTVRHSVDACDLYVICPECGHRFVWSAGYKHTISGSNKERMDVVKEIISNLPRKEKVELIGLLS